MEIGIRIIDACAAGFSFPVLINKCMVAEGFPDDHLQVEQLDLVHEMHRLTYSEGKYNCKMCPDAARAALLKAKGMLLSRLKLR